MSTEPMTEQEIVDACARLGVELSAWQRKWIRNWIAAGRPKSLPLQYACATAEPVEGAVRGGGTTLQGPMLP